MSFVTIPITKLMQNKYATIIDAKLHFCFVAFKALPVPVFGSVKCCIVYKCCQALSISQSLNLSLSLRDRADTMITSYHTTPPPLRTF